MRGIISTPLGKEPEHIAEVIGHPKEYTVPCYIALGNPAPEAVINRQNAYGVEEKIYINRW